MNDKLLEKIPVTLARNMVLDTIAAQNDFFRKMVFMDERLGTWVLTPGINAHGPDFCLACIEAVRKYDTFTVENDPYGERAMGSFEIEGKVIWWNIHRYIRTPEPGLRLQIEPNQTKRVLTVLFPSEIGGQTGPDTISSPPKRNERSPIVEKP